MLRKIQRQEIKETRPSNIPKRPNNRSFYEKFKSSLDKTTKNNSYLLQKDQYKKNITSYEDLSDIKLTAFKNGEVSEIINRINKSKRNKNSQQFQKVLNKNLELKKNMYGKPSNSKEHVIEGTVIDDCYYRQATDEYLFEKSCNTQAYNYKNNTSDDIYNHESYEDDLEVGILIDTHRFSDNDGNDKKDDTRQDSDSDHKDDKTSPTLKFFKHPTIPIPIIDKKNDQDLSLLSEAIEKIERESSIEAKNQLRKTIISDSHS